MIQSFAVKASVIISTYNRPDYLSRVLEGYFDQTEHDFEVIIADDGSKSETAEMIASTAPLSPVPVRHIWHPDEGFRLAAIRNKGSAKASSEYLIFTDDDCIPDRRFVQDHLRYAEKGCFIQGHRVLVTERLSGSFSRDDTAFRRLLALRGGIKNLTNAVRSPFPLIRKDRRLRGIRGCNFSLFKSDFISVNGFNEAFIGWGKEDSELVVRLFRAGLLRKDVKFRLCVYHLYHKEFDRGNLELNIERLEKTKGEEGSFCPDGLDKYL